MIRWKELDNRCSIANRQIDRPIFLQGDISIDIILGVLARYTPLFSLDTALNFTR
jgi:hypothetical protein